MEREVDTLSIEDVHSLFVDIEFPEYQREPDVWSRDQKQRLLDSILRKFDIASIYLYRRTDGGIECIDGRQRLNAIMSFLGDNPLDERDNGFPLKAHNEISTELPTPYEGIDRLTFAQIQEQAKVDASAHEAIQSIMEYRVSVVYLSEAIAPDEFNLQFLRLNLGTLINAGEKLNAMVGNMRDLLFESERIGGHPFFERVGIPTRRFAKELTAGQVLLQVFSKDTTGQFARARHFDLQKFVKAYADADPNHPIVADVAVTLDRLEEHLGDQVPLLRNRAITITVILFVWERRLFADAERLASFGEFLETFLGRLRWQVENMKEYAIDERYGYLVDFQRHLTQASVEKPAVIKRQEIFEEQFAEWMASGRLSGDAAYQEATGQPPPVR